MKIVSIASNTAIAPSVSLPLYNSRVQAGFPSLADDHINDILDLNTHLIRHPASTFFVRATGDLMIDVGIRDNDLLIVDKSLEATNGRVVIAVLGGEFTVKSLKIEGGGNSYLMPANKDFTPIKLCADSYVWGVVTKVIHDL